MKLFRTICAAVSALSLGIMSLPGVAAAAPATPEQVQAAYNDWQAAEQALADAVAAYNDGVADFNAAYEYCTIMYNNGWIYSSDVVPCRMDAENQWYLYDEPPLSTEISITFFEADMAEGYYLWIISCGNSCF